MGLFTDCFGVERRQRKSDSVGEQAMEIKITLEGGKRVATRIRDHLIMTDQSPKNGGGDSAPAPYDLFVASIGTCAGFYVQAYCEDKGIDASGIDITLAIRRNPETKQISGFVTTIHLPEQLPAKLHSALKKVVEQCAVTRTIMSNPEFIVETVSRKT
jgi:ribosomal protein S12 methylthiotransferase accessory factor